MSVRFPKPWYRPSRRTWFVTLDGKQISLGSDRDKAFRRYHQLMSHDRPKAAVHNDDLANVIDDFLDWCEQHRAPDTYRWYRDRLQRFITEAVSGPLRPAELRPYHVQRWIDGMQEVTGGTKRNYIRAIQRAMRWAEQQGILDRSPIAHMEKPAGGKREVVLSERDYRSLIAAAGHQCFRDLLELTWETGCRPQESLRLEARHVDSRHGRWVFPASEAKNKGKPRVVYLTENAIEITARLVRRHPVGPLLRNTRGAPWTPDAVNCLFTRLEKKIGKRFCLYNLRHTWMNRMLLSGVDGLTVAVLAGHSDPSTLARTYQHLSQNPEYLGRVARQGRHG